MLKSHNPELCSVCSKRATKCTDQSHKNTKEPKPVHLLHSDDKPKTKEKVNRPVKQSIDESDQSKRTEANESLFHMLGILETEFNDCKRYFIHKPVNIMR
jgi:hypothetical protein